MLTRAAESGDEEEANLVKNTKGVIFYSTPHAGSQVAKLNATSRWGLFSLNNFQWGQFLFDFGSNANFVAASIFQGQLLKKIPHQKLSSSVRKQAQVCWGMHKSKLKIDRAQIMLMPIVVVKLALIDSHARCLLDFMKLRPDNWPWLLFIASSQN